MMDLKEYCNLAADVLRSSERMVQRNVEMCRETSEGSGKYYNPDWWVTISQEEAAGLAKNLTDAANLFEVLSKNPEAAADLFRAHMSAQERGGV
ncbi:MAG: hypothetical protein JXR75_01015 [Rhodobacteraceae bacterium]|nr:hypothetical protein [Paracoccaceae bacterium]